MRKSDGSAGQKCPPNPPSVGQKCPPNPPSKTEPCLTEPCLTEPCLTDPCLTEPCPQTKPCPPNLQTKPCTPKDRSRKALQKDVQRGPPALKSVFGSVAGAAGVAGVAAPATNNKRVPGTTRNSGNNGNVPSNSGNNGNVPSNSGNNSNSNVPSNSGNNSKVPTTNKGPSGSKPLLKLYKDADTASQQHLETVSYLTDVFRTVPRGFSRDFGFGRNDKVIAASRNVDPSNLGYGEVTFQGMEPLYRALTLTAKDVFYDLGSGTGKLVLYVALRAEVLRSVGLELGEKRHKAAIIAGTRVQMDMQNGPSSRPKSPNRSDMNRSDMNPSDTIRSDRSSTGRRESDPTGAVLQQTAVLEGVPKGGPQSRKSMASRTSTKKNEAVWDSSDIKAKDKYNGSEASKMLSKMVDTGFSECRAFYSTTSTGGALTSTGGGGLGVVGSTAAGTEIVTEDDSASGRTEIITSDWCSPFEFHRADITQENYAPTNISVVYLSNLLMDNVVQSRTVEALLKAPTFRRLIAGTPVNHPRLKKIGIVRYSASWAKVTSATIYEILK